MSLVRSLMNSKLNSAYIDTSKYDCNNGALRIATESIEELHDIFMDGYIYEQAEIAAIREGVDLWDSRFQIVAESAISDGIKKLKEFFKNLWAKIKAIIKSIIMNIGAIFMKAKDFVKKYRKEIDAASNNLDGFEYKVYNYDDERINNLSDIESFDIEAYGQEMIERVSNSVEILRNCSKGISLYQGFHNTYLTEWKQVVNERDNAYKKLILAAISHSNKSKRNK